MTQKIKYYFMTLAATLMFAVPALVPASAYAQGCGNNNIANQVATGATKASGSDIGCGGTNVGSDGLANIARKIVDIFSIVVGAVAVIMIIYGGFRYITSGGSQESVGKAKNTLIYAIIGLLIVALAQLIVHFVLNQANTINNNGNGPATMIHL